MTTPKAKFPTPPAALVTGLLAGILTFALGVTQPASAAPADSASAGQKNAVAADTNRPTSRFLKQPMRFPPAA